MRVNFDQVFRVYPDGGIEPIRRIRIGGVEIGPGVRFTHGVSFGDIDLSLYVGRGLEVEEQVLDGQNIIWVLRGIY